jgi:hypothetical protein
LDGETRGARGQESCRGEMIVLEESRGGEEPEATQAGRPPLLKEPPGSHFLQASFPLLPLFVCPKPP